MSEQIWLAILGGTLIGSAAVWLFLSMGRIAGISGIAANALKQAPRMSWPLMFIIGLGAGGWLAYLLLGGRPQVSVSAESAAWMIIAGLLVGVGTRLGSGCTSGHGVCGMARFSSRSIVATLTFLVIGMITATGVAWLRGAV